MRFCKYYITSSFVITMLFLFWACEEEESLENVDCSKVAASYSLDIKPLVAANCNASGCHNENSINGDFTTYEGLKAKADNGTLSNRVFEKKDMPLTGTLSFDDLKKIKCWINSNSPNK